MPTILVVDDDADTYGNATNREPGAQMFESGYY